MEMACESLFFCFEKIKKIKIFSIQNIEIVLEFSRNCQAKIDGQFIKEAVTCCTFNQNEDNIRNIIIS